MGKNKPRPLQTLLYIFVLSLNLFVVLPFPIALNMTSSNNIEIERNLYSNIYHYRNGTSKITMFNDFVNYFNGTHFLDINTTIVESEDPLYDYMVKQGIYETYFKSNPATSETVKFWYNSSRKEEKPHKTGYAMFQPMSLNYRNDLNVPQQISMIQGVNGIPEENRFVYPDAFGDGLNISFSYFPSSLKETLIIENNESLPLPKQHIIDGGNVTLDMDFLLAFSDSVECYIDNELWDKKSNSKGERVDFRHNNETIFALPRPIALETLHLDEYEREIQRAKFLEYQLKKSGNKLYVIIKTPYAWLMSNLTYPITIDPTTEIIRPESDGFYSQWTYSLPSANHWENVDEEIHDGDTSYIATSGSAFVWQKDLFIISNISIPDGSVITNVLVNAIVRSASGMHQGGFRTLIRTHSTDHVGSWKNPPYAYISYVTEYNVNPFTALNWTVEEVNNLEVGVYGRSGRQWFGFPIYAYIYYSVKDTQVFAEITYVSEEPPISISVLFIGLLVFFLFIGIVLYLGLKRKK